MACRREIACKAHTDVQAALDEPGGFLEVNYSVPPSLPLESVLFTGSRFSNLYTAVDAPAEATAEPRGCVQRIMCACLYVNMCSDVLGSLSL
jgi:hypothetical protein